MKNILMKITNTALIFGMFTIFSCSSGSKNQNITKDSLMIQASIIGFGNQDGGSDSLAAEAMPDSIQVAKPSNDSVMNKINDLIKSTDHSDKKVSEIKVMKTQNQCLKQELKQTKADLKDAKEQIKKLDSVIKINEKKEKGFFRKVIDNIKGVKDSANTDTVK